MDSLKYMGEWWQDLASVPPKKHLKLVGNMDDIKQQTQVV